jgi:hypothetical protein
MKKYYKIMLTTEQTKKGINKDIMVVEAKNAGEAIKAGLKYCELRVPTNGSKWYVEDIFKIE